MKKILLVISILLNVVLVFASFRSNPDRELVNIKGNQLTPCGYMIIEFGKGIDCHGDTIKLVKRNGIQVRRN